MAKINRKGKTYEELYGKIKAKKLREKLSKSHMGHKISQKTINKRVATFKKRMKNGEIIPSMTGRKGILSPTYGKKISDKHKLLISNTLKKYYMNKENHPRWKGGKSFEEYGEKWTNKLKKKIRKRDKWQCQMCDCKDKEIIVHHIDYNKKNCSENNLISLCRSCHMTAHNKKSNYWIWQLQVFMKLFYNINYTPEDKNG